MSVHVPNTLATAQPPARRWACALLLARAALACGDPQRAVHALRRLVVVQPRQVAHWQQLALAAAAAGDARGAREARQRAHALQAEAPLPQSHGAPIAPARRPPAAAGPTWKPRWATTATSTAPLA